MITPADLTDDMVRALLREQHRDPEADRDITEFCEVALGGRPLGHPQYRSTITAINDTNAARRHICDYLNAKALKEDT